MRREGGGVGGGGEEVQGYGEGCTTHSQFTSDTEEQIHPSNERIPTKNANAAVMSFLSFYVHAFRHCRCCMSAFQSWNRNCFQAAQRQREGNKSALLQKSDEKGLWEAQSSGNLVFFFKKV